MLLQQLFKVLGVDVKPAGNDHILCAADNRNEAIFVDYSDIAGLQPDIAICVTPLHLAGLFWLVFVTGHHGRRTAGQNALGAGWQAVVVFIQYNEFMARNWLSNGMQLVRVVMGLQHADYAALSHTVNFDKPAWPTL